MLVRLKAAPVVLDVGGVGDVGHCWQEEERVMADMQQQQQHPQHRPGETSAEQRLKHASGHDDTDKLRTLMWPLALAHGYQHH